MTTAPSVFTQAGPFAVIGMSNRISRVGEIPFGPAALVLKGGKLEAGKGGRCFRGAGAPRLERRAVRVGSWRVDGEIGGADRARTDGLDSAIVALYQLSYSP